MEEFLERVESAAPEDQGAPLLRFADGVWTADEPSINWAARLSHSTFSYVSGASGWMRPFYRTKGWRWLSAASSLGDREGKRRTNWARLL